MTSRLSPLASAFSLRHALSAWALALATAVATAGCPMDDDEGTPDGAAGGAGSSGSAGQAGAVSLAGVVRRTAAIAPGQDGKGTLYVAALDVCSLTGAGTILGFVAVPGADLSAPGASVPFTIANLPRATVHLAVFLDDNGDASPSGPRPGPGDLAYGENPGDGIVNCVAADLANGGADGVAVDLNFAEEEAPGGG